MDKRSNPEFDRCVPKGTVPVDDIYGRLQGFTHYKLYLQVLVIEYVIYCLACVKLFLTYSALIFM